MLGVSDILQGTPRALVVTLTMWKTDPAGSAKPSPARTDSVFGPTRTKVCLVVCNRIPWWFDQITLLFVKRAGPDMQGRNHV